MPVKVSSTAAESANVRLIDTGGGFLIEEPVSGKQSSLTSKILYDAGCFFAVCLPFLSRLLVDLIKPVSNVRPPVRTSVHKKFLRFQ